MFVIVYGGNGWIGRKILKLLKENGIKYKNSQTRVENKLQLESEIRNLHPTHIISTIGRTHGTIGTEEYSTIDYLEQKGKTYENVRDNLFGPVVLAQLCTRYNVHLTYLGTGCIFSDTVNTKFTERSLPNFFGSSYSIVKGFTDELMHLYEANVLNVRIRMPITDEIHPRNFITKITNYEKICSMSNSMTVLNELLPVMLDMSEKKVTGTINLTNPGVISHNEILEMYRDIVDADFKWNNFTIEEQDKILESKRSNNCLDTGKLESMYPNVKSINDSVRDMLKQMAENKK